jgi:hypothetical protein
MEVELLFKYVWSEHTDKQHRSPLGVGRLTLWFSSAARPAGLAGIPTGSIDTPTD